jgi:hypothetical protein
MSERFNARGSSVPGLSLSLASFFSSLSLSLLFFEICIRPGATSGVFTHRYLVDLPHSASVVMLVGGIIPRAGYASGYIRGAVLHAYLAKNELNLPCSRLMD